ncbi:ATP-dependent RNA helicase DDX51/DBP6 [Angomonas deanei]|nr:ATP-dependent RNA helicase DDX51/DBP6 [Angomonas deanei]|eukprot:EPY33173.1 ATP-dependent RNA helicase DDX51/DBP6 [Angomonas deanei]
MTATWDSCFLHLKYTKWLQDTLATSLHYEAPLPIQSVMVPAVLQGLQCVSLPLDVSLTAPTGSGKTLCYVLPMLVDIAARRRGLDTPELRALVLVPTRALGLQVVQEIEKLTRHTSITVTSLCEEKTTVKEEGARLVRAVQEEGGQVRYYSNTDIIVSTPQRLLTHLDTTVGLALATLRLLVIDEADQVLVGSFATFVAKVLARYDSEVERIVAEDKPTTPEGNQAQNRNNTSLMQNILHNSETNPKARFVLQKILCSATLSARVASTSDIHLRNCRYYFLDTNGEEVVEGDDIDPNRKSLTIKEKKKTEAAVQQTRFSLPPKLQEHIIFVRDEYRTAVLLKLVSTLVRKIEQSIKLRRVQQKTEQLKQEEEVTGEQPNQEQEGEEEKEASPVKTADSTTEEGYPSLEDCLACGTVILLFCDSAEEARVVGHFLMAAGLSSNVLEFTSIATEEERRRALLQKNSARNVTVIVCSDAHMRGLDIHNVGHVVLYRAPQTLAAFVHRAGRTARAMLPGHLHVLLTKESSTGEESQSEVSQYLHLTAQVRRTLPLRYERGFFRFVKDPTAKAIKKKPEEKPTEETEKEEEKKKRKRKRRRWRRRRARRSGGYHRLHCLCGTVRHTCRRIGPPCWSRYKIRKRRRKRKRSKTAR